jgi:hypothetical protein
MTLQWKPGRAPGFWYARSERLDPDDGQPIAWQIRAVEDRFEATDFVGFVADAPTLEMAQKLANDHETQELAHAQAK